MSIWVTAEIIAENDISWWAEGNNIGVMVVESIKEQVKEKELARDWEGWLESEVRPGEQRASWMVRRGEFKELISKV